MKDRYLYLEMLCVLTTGKGCCMVGVSKVIQIKAIVYKKSYMKCDK